MGDQPRTQTPHTPEESRAESHLRRRPRNQGGSTLGGAPGGGWRIAALVLLVVAFGYLVAVVLAPDPEREAEVPYSPTFLEQVREGNVERVTAEGEELSGTFEQGVRVPEERVGDGPGATPDDQRPEPVEEFRTNIPEFADQRQLFQLLTENDVVVDVEPESDDGGLSLFLVLLLASLLPILLLVGFLYFAARRAGQGMGEGGPLGRFSRSRARRVEPTRQRVSFDDVAGIDEVKAALEELVDFLRHPRRYRAVGARIPRGVLLTGAPGTGKTLLARAVAGQADAPFFSITATEFVEALVGVGAARVRDMFKEAREQAPAIVFIDELDAVGRRRTSAGGIATGHEEREQTLNQILSEMDGFEPHEAVIVLAATNRPDDLDEALLRPGRFDRRLPVQRPDRKGRRKILEVHTRSLALGEDVDLERLAQTTPGMVGADLANLANEAALAAARRRGERVEMRDFLAALDRVALGAPRGMVLTEEDRRLAAYHEAGHALVAMLTPDADPVQKVSIIPRGEALGAMLAAPESDRVSLRRRYLRARMRVAFGGRIAEELACDDISTGAEDDLEQITEIARRMVGRWGMGTTVGPVSILPQDGRQPSPLPLQKESSDFTQRRVDEEVERLIDEAHDEVSRLLADNRERLDRVARALLERETLDAPEVYALARLGKEST